MTIKSDRVAELIHNHLSQLLLTEIRDPRLQGVSITEVRLDREIEHADIFVSALGDSSREQEVLQGLKKAQGYIRRELAGRLRLRRMPQLHFKWDHVLDQALRVEEVIDSLKIENEPDDDDISDQNTEDIDDE